MKRKVLWLVLSSLMVVALVLPSCAPAAVEEEGKTIVGKVVEEEEEAVVEVEEEAKGPEMVRDAFGKLKEKPRYGGTITVVWSSPSPTLILDPVIATRSVAAGIHTYSRLGIADWAKGPQGTNEFPFTSSFIPDEFSAGDVCESWEIMDLQTIVFKIRQNVYWHNVPPMNGRQFTAEDAVYAFERAGDDPQSTFYTAEERDPELPPYVMALDKFTLQIMSDTPDTRMLHGVLYWMYMQPREVVETYGDANDPDHQVGTGPFVVTDNVPDSSMTWKRNPNYHLVDPFFPENRLPYIDTLQAIVILDESTRLAALRTHKIERLGVPWDKVEGIKETNPELLNRKVLPDSAAVIFLRTDIEPFSDKKVRQAVTLAIDQPTIAEEFYGGNAYLLVWPTLPSFVSHYTPMDQLPELSQKLYQYQPELAREFLAEAGYPNGFQTEVLCPSSAPQWIDTMAIVKEYLMDVGIDMEIRILEPTTFGSTLYGKQYPAMIFLYWGNNGYIDAFGWAHGGWVSDTGVPSVYNFGNVVDDIAEETFLTVQGEADVALRNQMINEQNLREIDLCWEIPIPTPASFFFWMPWIKGYEGEVGVGPDPGENYGVFRYVWIDQDLKYEITGQRD